MEGRHSANLRDELLGRVEKIDNFNFIGAIVEMNSPDALKKLCLSLKDGMDNSIVVLASEIDGKAQVALMLDEKAIVSIGTDAPSIIKNHIAPLIKGGGGGQKTLATAGGQDATKLQEVIQTVRSLLKS